VHFDILVETGTSFETVRQDGADDLAGKHVVTDTLTASECRRCHVEAASEDAMRAIDDRGYTMVEIDPCD
jgi:hypothetical protein